MKKFIILIVLGLFFFSNCKRKKNEIISNPVLDLKPPSILIKSPGENSENIPLNVLISTTFSEAINTNTIINKDSFRLKKITTPPTEDYQEGIFSFPYQDTFFFKPSPALSEETIYEVSLSPKISDLAGNINEQEIKWIFKTGKKPDLDSPQIKNIFPKPNTKNIKPVSETPQIIITFDENINQSTLNNQTIKLKKGEREILISMNLPSTTPNEIKFYPVDDLEPAVTYDIVITSGITDLAGNLFEGYAWSFNTQIQLAEKWNIQSALIKYGGFASINFITTNQGWVAGEKGIILQTKNQGEEWIQLPTLTDAWIHSLTFLNSDNGWAVTGTQGNPTKEAGLIYHTKNGGNSWDLQYENTVKGYTFSDIEFINSEEGWAVGSPGVIMHTANGGETWEQQISSTTQYLLDVDFVDINNGWAVGGNMGWIGIAPKQNLILSTENGGKIWINKSKSDLPPLWAVFFLNNSEGWITGDTGEIFHTLDYGEHWEKQITDINLPIHSIYFLNQDSGWAIGNQGLILKTSDGGKNWISQESGVTVDLVNLKFINNTREGWIAGKEGTILYTEKGEKWIRRDNFAKEYLKGVFFIDQKEGWTVGKNGRIYHTIDSGINWNTQKANSNNNLNSIFFSDLTHGWIAADNGILLLSTDQGKFWQQIDLEISRNLNALYFLNEQGWIIGDNSLILHTSDGGMWGKTSWINQNISSSANLNAVKFIDPLRGWISGNQGLIARTDNSGDKWEIKTTNTEKNIYGIYFVNKDIGFACGEKGLILFSVDGGETWREQNSLTDKTLRSIYFADPYNGWIAGEHGTLLLTEDQGNTWTKINGLPLNSLAGLYFSDPVNGWAVGEGGIIIKGGII